VNVVCVTALGSTTLALVCSSPSSSSLTLHILLLTSIDLVHTWSCLSSASSFLLAPHLGCLVFYPFLSFSYSFDSITSVLSEPSCKTRQRKKPLRTRRKAPWTTYIYSLRVRSILNLPRCTSRYFWRDDHLQTGFQDDGLQCPRSECTWSGMTTRCQQCTPKPEGSIFVRWVSSPSILSSLTLCKALIYFKVVFEFPSLSWFKWVD
jgi:hypothetical protein